MKDDYISWENLANKWGLLDGELRQRFILTGLLQPRDDAGDPVQPPGVKEIQRELYAADRDFRQACSNYYSQRGRHFDRWNLDKDNPYDQTIVDIWRNMLNYIEPREAGSVGI